MPWDPDTYNKFKTERFAPFDDLLKVITVKPALKVIDLGCGTGELTQKLAAYLPGSSVLGIDSSEEMLKQSVKFTTKNCTFKKQDIEAVLNEKNQWDIVFSNAALQWVQDHNTLFPRVISMLKTGGQLAIQVPSNNDHYTHVAIKEIAAIEPYRSALRNWARTAPVLKTEAYAQILFDNGVKTITVYEKVYPHVLKDADALA
jgi:trans-aconitate 2-methyltransferase